MSGAYMRGLAEKRQQILALGREGDRAPERRAGGGAKIEGGR